MFLEYGHARLDKCLVQKQRIWPKASIRDVEESLLIRPCMTSYGVNVRSLWTVAGHRKDQQKRMKTMEKRPGVHVVADYLCLVVTEAVRLKFIHNLKTDTGDFRGEAHRGRVVCTCVCLCVLALDKMFQSLLRKVSVVQILHVLLICDRRVDWQVKWCSLTASLCWPHATETTCLSLS